MAATKKRSPTFAKALAEAVRWVRLLDQRLGDGDCTRAVGTMCEAGKAIEQLNNTTALTKKSQKQARDLTWKYTMLEEDFYDGCEVRRRR